MSPISLKDTWFMRELKSYLILKLLVSPWHLIFLPPNHHQHQFLCMLWHCYGNPEGWRNSLHLSSQRVMRQEWWIVCWKLCSRGLPSATEEKGHQSQKVNIILVSCYFLGNYHKEQLFFFFPFNSFQVVCQECSALGSSSSEVSWVCLILPLQWQMSGKHSSWVVAVAH